VQSNVFFPAFLGGMKNGQYFIGTRLSRTDATDGHITELIKRKNDVELNRENNIFCIFGLSVSYI
jgi:hypothetical protein